MEYTYIHETDTIYESNGELHLVCGDRTVIFCCEYLFNDLPFILERVLNARKETDERIKEEIINTINKNK
jgi:hypothetical protein